MSAFICTRHGSPRLHWLIPTTYVRAPCAAAPLGDVAFAPLGLVLASGALDLARQPTATHATASKPGKLTRMQESQPPRARRSSPLRPRPLIYGHASVVWPAFGVSAKPRTSRRCPRRSRH